MRKVFRFFNRLSIKIIVSIIILVTLLTLMIGFFGYQVFTQTMKKENAAFLRRVAEAAFTDSMDWDFSAYLEMGKERMDKLGHTDTYELKQREADDDVLTFNYYQMLTSRLSRIVFTQELRELRIIVPKEETDYSTFNIVFGELVSEDGILEVAELGKELRTGSEEETAILKNLWTSEEKEGVIYRYLDKEDGGATMTLYRALGVEGDAPKGILVITSSIQGMVDAWQRYLIGITIMGMGMAMAGVVFIGLYLRLRVVKPMKNVTREANRFAIKNAKAEGNLTDSVGNVTELRVLAESIDKMEEDTLKNMDEIAQMSRESERLETELSLASDIQKGILPKGDIISERKEFDVAAIMHPAREVGGDFYDFFMLDDTHLVLLIADVSDKGMGAAFFMAISKTILKARTVMGGSAVDIITFVEEKLSETNDAGMFVTAWLGIVDLTTGEVDVCNAGHEFPAILQKSVDEKYRIEKTEHGPAICFLPGMGHVPYHFRLEPGDRIFLYTDGVTEAKALSGERFGNDRLLEALNKDCTTKDEELIARVKAHVDSFVGEAAQYDDITLVSFTYLGNA